MDDNMEELLRGETVGMKINHVIREIKKGGETFSRIEPVLD
jgi:hypothetical protein